MKLLKTAFAFAVTGIAVVVLLPFGITAVFFSLLGLKKSMSYVMYTLVRGWARLLIFLVGCPMTVAGRENIPKKGGICFVSNHEGIFDVVLALAYAGRPFGFIAKKELLLVPGLNLWISLLGGLFIDRTKARSAVKTINLGIKRLKAGGGMLVFPEGTRSRGRGIAPFHPGSLKLATQSGSTIVPMAITGSYDVFEKTYRVCAVPVSISFLPPVYPAALLPESRKQILADQIHDRIAAELRNHSSPQAGLKA
jgi:1-acyl-sn-glycerol-3-phosphate acyltransferase